MVEATSGSEPQLAQHLKDLRQGWNGVTVTQKQIADAFGVSTGLISSWESGAAIPPESRLQQYARFFSTKRSMDARPPALLTLDDLRPEEEQVRQARIKTLVALRSQALRGDADDSQGLTDVRDSFWHFPDGQSVTLLCTPMSRRQLLLDADPGSDAAWTPAQQYALNPTHPNSIRNFTNGDIDALVELVGHIRAQNPTTDVQWFTTDRHLTSDDLTGHIVILGGSDFLGPAEDPRNPVRQLAESLRLPLKVEWLDPGDPEFDCQFIVTEDANGDAVRGGSGRDLYRPRFLRDESQVARPYLIERGARLLENDIALMSRAPNPLNRSATVTICTGLFSRGTYGAVRTFTDANLRIRNETYLSVNFPDPDNFWVLFEVPVFVGERTVTPDLGSPLNRLRASS